MSNTFYRLEFSVIVADMDNWTDEQHEKFETEGMDGVVEVVRAAMLKAGNDVVAKDPDLFKGEVM